MKNLKTVIFYNIKINEIDLVSLPLNSVEKLSYSYFTNNISYTELELCISYFINLKEIETDCHYLTTDNFCKRLLKCDQLKIINFRN